jgi:hypothetical protein
MQLASMPAALTLTDARFGSQLNIFTQRSSNEPGATVLHTARDRREDHHYHNESGGRTADSYPGPQTAPDPVCP